MKKFIIILSAALLALAGCNQFIEETPLEKEYVNAPSITIGAKGDSSFVATISPVAGTGFYSYTVLAGKATEVNKTSLFKTKLGGLVNKTVNYSNDKTATISLTGLNPNSDYTVYAVAASAQGVLGDVVYAEVHTTDSEAPALKSYTFEKDSAYVTLKFTENVNYVEGKKILATAYAKLYVTGNPVAKNIEGEVVSCADGNAVVAFKDITIPGTYYMLYYEAGTFEDEVGNALPELAEGKFTNSGSIKSDGVFAYLNNAECDLKVDDIEVFTDYNTYFVKINVPTMINGVKASSVDVKVVSENAGTTTTTEWTLERAPYYGALNLYTIGIKLDREPQRGDYVTLTVKEGAVEDIYGNENAELEIGPMLYSYAYNLEDVLGTYENAGTSAYGGDYDEDPWTFTLAKSDDEEKGNVMITDYYGFKNVNIYADFDTDLGTLTMPTYYKNLGTVVDSENQVVYYYYDFGYYTCIKKALEKSVLYMTELGKFTGGNDYLGYYIEIYKLPASGNLEDITDDDFVDYDYNIFVSKFSKTASATTSLSSKYVVNPIFPTRHNVTFTREIK